MGNFFSPPPPTPTNLLKDLQQGNTFEFLELNQTETEPNPNSQFSVLSYNILAEAYSGHFKYEVDEKYLGFAYRSPIIIEELKALSADIICLQEVDNYEKFYKKELKNLGYKTIYGAKTSGAPDGCLIGIKKDNFAILDKEIIQFDKGHAYENAAVFKRGNIAIVSKLLHRATGQKINLICTHFYWEPRLEQVKYLQMSQLLKYVNSKFDENDIVILAGDLNLRPFSNTLQYFLNGTEPTKENLEFPNPSMLKTMVDIYQNLETVEKKIKWGNVYQSYQKAAEDSEELTYPKYTNYTGKFKDTIDHILYTQASLNVRRMLKIPTEAVINCQCLPNQRFPSDHLPIMAVFEILQKVKKIV